MPRNEQPQPKHRHQQALTLATLGELAAGQAEVTINAALRAALRDTEDRGADGKPRKVTIEVELKKTGPDHVVATVKAKTNVPAYQTEPTIGQLQLDNGQALMAFSPSAPDNPDQGRLPGAE
jgi:hypothetical protein